MVDVMPYKDPEQRRAYQQAYQQEYQASYGPRYREEHREEIRARKARWYAENRAALDERARMRLRAKQSGDAMAVLQHLATSTSTAR